MSPPHGPVNKRAVLILCCLAQFMVILDVSIVNVALPSIRADLGFSAADLQWVVNAYTLAFAGFLLLGGRAVDLVGRREVFVGGLIVFGAASLVGGLAPGKGLLVAARALQGLGGAIVAPSTLAILSTTFTEGSERNRALGAWGAMGAAGGATGALIGGVLTELLDWRWILFINVPVAAGGAIAGLRYVPTGRRARGERRDFDLTGALIVTAGLVLLTYGIVGSERHGWGSAHTLGFAAAGVALLGLFLVVESRFARAPLVPLRIFGSRVLAGANVVVFCMGSAVFAMWYFMSLYMQEVLGFTPIQTGLAFLPMTATLAATSTLSSRLAHRVGPGRQLMIGMGLVGLGMLGLSRVGADSSWLEAVLVPSVVTAAGIGASFVPTTIAAVAGVAPQEAGLASGLVNTSRQVGGSLGLAVLVTLATTRTADARSGGAGTLQALTSGFDHGFAVGAAFALAGAVAATLLLPHGPLRRPAAQPA